MKFKKMLLALTCSAAVAFGGLVAPVTAHADGPRPVAAAAKKAKPKSKAPQANKTQVAVKAAMSQVGKRYRLGTSGPSSFDCSGLTKYAFGKGGVKLPHSARQQSSKGKYVSKSNLKRGDLVFFYRPVSHVGIYLGNGEIVHAGNRRTGVNVTKLKYMPFAGARRVI